MITPLESLERTWVEREMARLESELFGIGAWSETAVAQELSAPARTYLFDVDGSELRGYAGFWYDGDDAEIMTIGVKQSAQRQGVASRLMSHLIEDAQRQGARRMLLEVRVDNNSAIGLYQKFGFRTLGLRKRYYQPQGIDAYTMSLDLQPHIAGFASATAAQPAHATPLGQSADNHTKPIQDTAGGLTESTPATDMTEPANGDNATEPKQRESRTTR